MHQTDPLALPDLTPLLAPAPGPRAAGSDLRYDSIYDQIKEARREDDAALPQGDWQAPLKRADWILVERLCQEALANRSKDLQIAAWLMEAWLHRYGLTGANHGLRLLHGLCAHFWDALYPEISEGDLEFREAPFLWLDEKLPIALRRLVPITVGDSNEGRAYTLSDWENTLLLENTARRDRNALKQGEQDGKIPRAKFLASVTLTQPSFYQQLSAELQETGEALDLLHAELTLRFGPQAPVLHRMRQTLAALSQAIHDFVGQDNPTLDAPTQTENLSSADPRYLGTFAGAGPIRSRDEAYRRLSEAAEFLLRTEPHSPTPYLVKRAVGWGSMSLSELLEELVDSESDLRSMYSLLGMPR